MYNPAGSSVVNHTLSQLCLGTYTTGTLHFAAGQTISAHTPIAIKTADKLAYKHDPAAADGTQNAIGINVHDVDTTDGSAYQPIYDGGKFNAEAINWHVSLDTLDKQKAAFVGKGINISLPV